MQPELIGGRYRVQRAIGQGGMGTVWLCRDETLAREVAVKQVGLLPGESVTDSARALREARSSAALSHRNVVTVFDVVEEDGRIWLVMENVPSRSLSELIRDEGPLPPEEVAAIGAQVADGLAAAHAAGITHRDVKPGNVLVRADGVAKISDFGIARTAGDPALTQTGLFIGTPTYFSPELARGAEPDPSADVWALGATLYAAVEGHPPFEQKTNAVAVISEIATQPPPPPRQAGELEPVLGRMLDGDPLSRWAMADAAHALHRIADRHAERTRATTTAALSGRGAAAGTSWTEQQGGRSGTTTATATSPVPPAGEVSRGGATTERFTRQPSRNPSDPSGRGRTRSLLALAAIVLLLVGGLAFVAMTNDSDPETSPKQPSSQANSPDQTAEPSQPDSSEGQAPGTTAGGRAFVRDYFATVPGDLDAAWGKLSPRMQETVGRDSYDGFWGTVSSVTASNLTRRGDSVDVTLRYNMKDGRVETERHRIGLVPDGDGGHLIDSDTAIG